MANNKLPDQVSFCIRNVDNVTTYKTAHNGVVNASMTVDLRDGWGALVETLLEAIANATGQHETVKKVEQIIMEANPRYYILECSLPQKEGA